MVSGAHEKSHTLRRIALFLRSAAFFVLVVLTCGIYFFVPAAPTIAVIQATTEYVGYEVAAPDLVQIKLAGYALTYESGGDTLLVCRTLKQFEELLTGHGFFRIHHSHLINLRHLRSYVRGKGGYVVMSNGREFEVSVRRKEEFLTHIGL